MSKVNRQKKGGKRKGKKMEAMRGSVAARQPDAPHTGTHREIEKGHSQKFVAPPVAPAKKRIKRVK